MRVWRLLFLSLSVLMSPVVAGEQGISVQDLYKRIEAGKAPVIVDVRTTAEYKDGHIPGAIHIPFWWAYWRSDRIPASGQDPVVVYCAHGPRAYAAGFQLRLSGIANVLYMDGHMTAWRKAGLPEAAGIVSRD